MKRITGSRNLEVGEQPNRQRSWWLRGALMFVISLLLGLGGAYLAARKQLFELSMLKPTEVRPEYVALAVMTSFLFWFAPAVRLYLMLSWHGERVTIFQAVCIHFGGWFGTAITPGKGGSGPVIAMMLRRIGLPWGNSIYSALYLGVLDIVFFSIALPLSGAYLLVSGILSLSVIAQITVLAMTCVLPFIAYFFIGKPRQAVRFLHAVSEWRFFRKIKTQIRNTANDYFRASLRTRELGPGKWISLVFTTAVAWFALYSLLWALLEMYGFQSSLIDVITSLNVISSIAILIPTPGASGYMELVVSVSTSRMHGIGSSLSSAPLFIWRSLTYYLAFLLGPLSAWGIARKSARVGGRSV